MTLDAKIFALGFFILVLGHVLWYTSSLLQCYEDLWDSSIYKIWNLLEVSEIESLGLTGQGAERPGVDLRGAREHALQRYYWELLSTMHIHSNSLLSGAYHNGHFRDEGASNSMLLEDVLSSSESIREAPASGWEYPLQKGFLSLVTIFWRYIWQVTFFKNLSKSIYGNADVTALSSN